MKREKKHHEIQSNLCRCKRKQPGKKAFQLRIHQQQTHWNIDSRNGANVWQTSMSIVRAYHTYRTNEKKKHTTNKHTNGNRGRRRMTHSHTFIFVMHTIIVGGSQMYYYYYWQYFAVHFSYIFFLSVFIWHTRCFAVFFLFQLFFCNFSHFVGKKHVCSGVLEIVFSTKNDILWFSDSSSFDFYIDMIHNWQPNTNTKPAVLQHKHTYTHICTHTESAYVSFNHDDGNGWHFKYPKKQQQKREIYSFFSLFIQSVLNWMCRFDWIQFHLKISLIFFLNFRLKF